MQSHHKSGKQITLTASGAAIATDSRNVVGKLLAIAVNTIADGSTGPGAIEGHFINQPKATGAAVTAGQLAYYDESADEFSTLSDNGTNLACGVFAAAATAGATTCEIILVPELASNVAIGVISHSFTYADMTDGGGATGHVDWTAQLPAGAVPLATKTVCTEEFAGDTSAVIQHGVSGDVDRFSSATDQSVFAAGTVGSGVPADACDGIASAQTVRTTITTDSDFSAVVAAENGAATAFLFYIATA